MKYYNKNRKHVRAGILMTESHVAWISRLPLVKFSELRASAITTCMIMRQVE